MDIWDLDKLVLFVMFIIPGFISMKVYDLIHPDERLESTRFLVEAIAYSCFNYAVWSVPIIFFLEKDDGSNTFGVVSLTLLVLLVSPVLLALFVNWLRSQDFIQRNVPHPVKKPWDFVFRQRESYWVVVTLSDGTRVAGKYGENSFTSSYPAAEQIYLEESWFLNKHDGFKRPKTDTAGIIIVKSDIKTVELFKYKRR